MRDHETRTPHRQRVHRLLNQFFGTRIDGRGRLVQNQNRRILHHRARNRQQLLLTLRQRRLVIENRVIAIRQRHDVVVQPNGLACGDDLLVGHALLGICDVFTHRSTEHPRILQHHRELIVHIPARHRFGIDAINRNRAAGNLVEAHKQVHHRGLAGTGRADDGDLLTGLHRSGEVVDDRFVGFVAEAYVAEFHVTTHRLRPAVRIDAKQRPFIGFVGQLRLLQEAEHALGCGGAALQVLEGLRELRQRLREQADVHHERHDHAELDLAIHRKHRTDHAYDHIAEITDEIHQRHHQAGQELALPTRHVQVLVVAFEAADGIGLATVRLDHGMPGIHLLNMAVHIAEGRLLAREVLLRGLHDAAHHDQAEQCGADGAQR